MEKFYISCPLGLEKICWEEISHKWGLFLNSKLPQAQFSQGGVSISCELCDGLAINLFSRTSNRILLRLKEQKCRDIPKLFNIIAKIPWKNYLKREDALFQISSHESRLFNSKKIEKAAQDGLKKYFNANQLPQKIKEQKEDFHRQTIFLRFEDDLLTLSLDTSGELLHIRGGDKFRGHASIRSTLASCLLWPLLKEQENYTLIDPMCGTGTFLKEAFHFYDFSSKEFSFQDWSDELIFNKILKQLPIKKLVGFDNDANIIAKNLELPFPIAYQQKNIFQDEYTKEEKTIVICNPPYGKRVKLDRPRERYFQELVDIIIEKLQPYKMGIILPLDIKLRQKTKKIKIFNSGIWLNYHLIDFSGPNDNVSPN